MNGELTTAPGREGEPWHGSTGIYVRAVDAAGRWGSFDIAELSTESLFAWLRSRGGRNAWAESVVLILLGHDPGIVTGDGGPPDA